MPEAQDLHPRFDFHFFEMSSHIEAGTEMPHAVLPSPPSLPSTINHFAHIERCTLKLTPFPFFMGGRGIVLWHRAGLPRIIPRISLQTQPSWVGIKVFKQSLSVGRGIHVAKSPPDWRILAGPGLGAKPSGTPSFPDFGDAFACTGVRRKIARAHLFFFGSRRRVCGGK